MEGQLYQPTTLTEAIRYYSNTETCINAVAMLRWQDGSPVCPKCGATQDQRNHYWLATQKRWKCHSCRKQFSVKVGTIFEDSPLSLDIWLVALWMLCNCRNGVSSYEIARATGIAQKSAWFVLQRLRFVLKDTMPVMLGDRVDSPVEVDECFIGGKPKNMHRNRRLERQVAAYGYAEKTPVFGMLERGTRQVRASVIPNVKRETLQKKILDNVGFGATVYSDGWAGYDGLKAAKFVHETVNHMDEYVRGSVSTQAIENFWSCLKRTLGGTYVAVEPFHLDRYLDEQMFRFNNRIGHTDGTRFQKALGQVGGKRLTWVELTGKEYPKAV
ncbi:IS1595 family transposase [Tunturiibacter psychrotolerans]|uniref:IS1595 family transposase n=1 Tax=Tunturiibacter psychrotolerans TaxID=3069686 RepID=UPI003D2495FF